MKLLITGASGQIGCQLTRQCLSNHYEGIALAHRELDITRANQIADALARLQPNFVINTAAYTAVDKAEQESEFAFTVNRDGPALLAQACAKANIPFIHLSTDYVFGGTQSHPYKEEDPIEPLNIYGQSKWAGEMAVREYWDKHIILRVSGVFSIYGHNFVKTILQLAQTKETLRIVADQIICPTPARDITRTILGICEKLFSSSPATNLWGTYHFCSTTPTSWYNFAKNITANAVTYKPLAVKEWVAIPTSEYPTPAKRPAYSVLDCTKLQSQFGIQPCSWEAGLAEVVKLLCQ